MSIPKEDERTPGLELFPVSLAEPWSGLSRLDIGPYKIGIAITNEDGHQDPEAAGAALESWVKTCNSVSSLREALAKLTDAVDIERRTYEDYRRLFDPERPIPSDKVVDRTGDAFDAAYAATNEAAKEARAALNGVTQSAKPTEISMTEAQIKNMVDRFLSWKLPESFNPDGGINFERTFNEHTPHPSKHEPYGTNLFNFDEATAMVRHMLEGFTSQLDEARAKAIEECAQIADAELADPKNSGRSIAKLLRALLHGSTK